LVEIRTLGIKEVPHDNDGTPTGVWFEKLKSAWKMQA